ncbi:MAG: aminopeptidase P N-terminal domain-containing protein [Nitrospirae bacterium]|nr:aminopeptidase P N-terminal domain-containing protein [Nitrospirota bacterium]
MAWVDKGVHARRRERFMAAIDGAIAIFAGAPETVRSNDVHHRYRQESDFLYLTGFAEPGAYLVLDAGANRHRYTLYVPPKDPAMERWTGRRAGVAGARRRFGADAAHEAGTFFDHLARLLAGRDRVYLRLGYDAKVDQAVIDQIATMRGRSRAGAHGPAQVVDPTPILAEQRLLKSEAELDLLQRAVDITAQGHLAAMRALRPGMAEYEVEAEIEYHFRRAGAAGPAYPTICGSGVNATILHYVENDRRMRRGDLLLIDAGAEYGGYAGDVTRTIPVGGRFGEAQRAVYEVVLNANRVAIRRVRPGVTFDAVHHAAVRELTRGLVRLGLLTGDPKKLIQDGAYRRFYMHRTSHWLGLDVHDVGRYYLDDHKPRPLEPGMVLTIEPGLYIDAAPDIPKPFHGIGIRIEDDVLVTDGPARVLSAAIPKDVDAIERAMAGA